MSPNGQYFVTGSVDGLIEVWNLEKGVIRSELVYQKEVEFVLIENGIGEVHGACEECVEFGVQRGFRVSGVRRLGGNDQNLARAKWRAFASIQLCPRGGRYIVVFQRQQSTSVFREFRRNRSVENSRGYVNCRIHGLKSGKTLKTFQGHQRCVSSSCMS